MNVIPGITVLEKVATNRAWRTAAAKDHAELVAKIKERYSVDLANTRVRIRNQPVYSDGKPAPEHDASSLGSSAHAAARPFVAIRPRLDFERVMHNYGLGTAVAPLPESRVAAMRRYIQGHELLHSVEAQLTDTERAKRLKLISASGFETDYTKINPKDKERIVEHMAAEMGLDTGAGDDMNIIPGITLTKTANRSTSLSLYHGSNHKIDMLEPRDDHGDPDVPAAVFATPHKQMALAYLGGRWGDRDINQGSRGVNDKGWYLQEMRPGAFDDSYKGQEGWLHELPPESFARPKRSRGSSFELISTDPVTPVRAKRIKNIRLALRRAGVQLVPYGSDPKMHEMAVKHMRQRIGLFDEQERERYLRWVGETNPELKERLTKQSAYAVDTSKYDALYSTFDKGHDEQHQRQAVEAALMLADRHAPRKRPLVELAAKLHDVGLSKGREQHEIHGADIVANDPELQRTLPKRDLRVLVNAVRQHRASTGRPRSVVGKIVSDADRIAGATSEGALRRAVEYRRAHTPRISEDEMLRDAHIHLAKKYGPGGYGRRSYFPETAARLDEIYSPIVTKAQAEYGYQPRLNVLLAAKAHSDAKRYAHKHQLMQGLMQQYPDEFVIDSEGKKYHGITHTPTGFRMHLPRQIIRGISVQRSAA